MTTDPDRYVIAFPDGPGDPYRLLLDGHPVAERQTLTAVHETRRHMIETAHHPRTETHR